MRRLSPLAAVLICVWTSIQAGQTVVTASFSLPGDWARVLLGETVQLHVLAGPNTDLHAYQASPADTRKLLASDLIIGIDPSLEPWLEEITSSNNLSGKVLWLGKPWLSERPGAPKKTYSHRHSGDCNHGECLHGDEDPHLWMDPLIVEAMVGALAQRCAQLPGMDQRALTKRRADYTEAVRSLDKDIADALARIPAERRIIVTHHGNLGRFADRYGIRIAGVILRSSSTEAADPSARALAELIRVGRERGVAAVIRDRGQRAPAADTLARATGLPPPVELSVDSLDAPGTPSDSWLGMMRENTRLLTEALSPR